MDGFDKIVGRTFKIWIAMFVFYALAFGGVIWTIVWAINKFAK